MNASPRSFDCITRTRDGPSHTRWPVLTAARTGVLRWRWVTARRGANLFAGRVYTRRGTRMIYTSATRTEP